MNQIGFDSLLAAADQQNRDRAFERKAGHLPSTIEDGVILFTSMIEEHHAATMRGDIASVMAVRERARILAQRLNNGENGYLAEGAPGRVLEAMTKAQVDTIPLWGQTGSFVIDVDGMRLRIELDGLFGIGSSVGFWPGFSAHIVDSDKPFFSETGYRSFLGLHADAAPGLTPDVFTGKVIAAYIQDQRRSRKGKRR